MGLFRRDKISRIQCTRKIREIKSLAKLSGFTVFAQHHYLFFQKNLQKQ